MANYKLLNRLTNTFNIDLPDNLFDIKTQKGRENYYIPSYCIIAEDELSLTNVKNTTYYVEIEKKGRDTAMRLFRQLKNETAFYVSAAQNISRNAKLFRELANSYFEILSLSIVGVQKRFSWVFQKKEEKLDKKMHKKKNKGKELHFKKQIYDAYQEQNKIFAAGFLKYEVRIAYSDKDLDRYDKSDLRVVPLYIPMTWCFGTYLKCQFQELDDFLTKESNKSDADLKVIDSFMASSDPIVFKTLLKTQEEKEAEKLAEEEAKKKQKEAKKKEGVKA